LEFGDGAAFTGKFNLGKDGLVVRHGYGTYTAGDGAAYVGEWAEDKMHGIGRITMVDGSVYDGEFSEGNFHGKGTYTWPDGSCFSGIWANNVPNQSGNHVDNSGVTWVRPRSKVEAEEAEAEAATVKTGALGEVLTGANDDAANKFAGDQATILYPVIA